eukprot:2654400-Pyramimonas_sp.AAC.1
MVIDVGTNNTSLLGNEHYLGVQRKRCEGSDYIKVGLRAAIKPLLSRSTTGAFVNSPPKAHILTDAEKAPELTGARGTGDPPYSEHPHTVDAKPHSLVNTYG